MKSLPWDLTWKLKTRPSFPTFCFRRFLSVDAGIGLALTPASNPIRRRLPRSPSRVFRRPSCPIRATRGIELSLESCGLRVRPGRQMEACLLPEERICTDVDNNGGLCCTRNQIAASCDLFYRRIILHFVSKSGVSACLEIKGVCFLRGM